MDIPPAQPHQDQVSKGMLYGIAAFFVLAVMAVFVKLLGERFTVFEIATYRNFIPLIALLAYISATKKHHLFKTAKPRALLLRVTIGSIALILTFGAIKALPLANATVLFFTSTLLVPVLSLIFLDDKIGKHRIIAACVGFAGVLILARPGADFAGIGVMLALGAALGHAIIQIFLRYLKTENPLTVTLYFCLGGAIIPAFFIPFDFTMPTLGDLPYLLAVGISGGLAQIFLTNAFRNAPATVISPFNYTGLVWASGFDILIWHLVPGWPVFIGGAIIIGSNLYILHRERLHERNKQTD